MTSETGLFAGGCFWCMVQPFDTQPGIISVTSGYTGGHTINPTYEEVCGGQTRHTEAVEIKFDADIISFDELVAIYWRQTDPTDAFGQFQDRGESYRPVIFYYSEQLKEIAERSKEVLQSSGQFDNDLIVTKIEKAQTFYPAEDYHQQFYEKNPDRYQQQHQVRDQFIATYWEEQK